MSEKVREVTAESFEDEVLQAEGTVMVDFWASWCPPCRRLAPVLEQLAERQEGRLGIVKLDVDAAPEVASRYGIRSIPTLIVFRDGRPLERRLGALPLEELERFALPHLAPAMETGVMDPRATVG